MHPRAVFFVLLSLMIIYLDHSRSYMTDIRAKLSVVVYPLQFVVNFPVKMTNLLLENMSTHSDLVRENRRLRSEYLLLSSKLQRLPIIEQENKRLRGLLDSSLKFNNRALVADLISVSSQPFSEQITINKGLSQEIYEGQPVVDAHGVVGQVIQVGNFYSTVLLIIDPSHAIPVQVERNGLRAIMVGRGRGNRLQLKDVPYNFDIKQGDLLISSGLGQRFPRGYPIGEVSKITINAAQSFAEVLVEPKAKIGKIRELLLIWTDDYGVRTYQ